MPIFASEKYLQVVGDDYGWLTGRDSGAGTELMLPYTIIRRGPIRLVRFRVETIYPSSSVSIADERRFLSEVVSYFRMRRIHMIMPGSTNAIFRTVPYGAIAAPYGTHRVDLTQSEDELWSNLHSRHRNHIRRARRSNVSVSAGHEYLLVAHSLIVETLRRTGLSFMSTATLRRMATALGKRLEFFVCYHEGILQGCSIVAYSNHSANYLYGGSSSSPADGALKLLHWETMRFFQNRGVKTYDFVGTRLNPPEGSKQAGLLRFKERFGGKLVKGYMWKYPLRPIASKIYAVTVRVARGGDIVDQELRRIQDHEDRNDLPERS